MTEALRTLYPPIEPYESGMLDVGDGHASTGSFAAIRTASRPFSCTAGRAAASRLPTASFSIPTRYRVLLFDQRGCGQSTPHAELEANTTWHLVADIERLREHIGVERWQVFGGSWGSTLALAYAETHPERVTRTGSARHLHAAPRRAALVLPGGRVAALSRQVGALPRADPGGGAGRPDRRLPQAAHRVLTRPFVPKRHAPGACGRARRSRCFPTAA